MFCLQTTVRNFHEYFLATFCMFALVPLTSDPIQQNKNKSCEKIEEKFLRKDFVAIE